LFPLQLLFWEILKFSSTFHCLNQSNRATLKNFCVSVCSGRDVAPSVFSAFPSGRRTFARTPTPVGPGSRAGALPSPVKWSRASRRARWPRHGRRAALAGHALRVRALVAPHARQLATWQTQARRPSSLRAPRTPPLAQTHFPEQTEPPCSALLAVIASSPVRPAFHRSSSSASMSLASTVTPCPIWMAHEWPMSAGARV
jgi:hypothetical protein